MYNIERLNRLYSFYEGIVDQPISMGDNLGNMFIDWNIFLGLIQEGYPQKIISEWVDDAITIYLIEMYGLRS